MGGSGRVGHQHLAAGRRFPRRGIVQSVSRSVCCIWAFDDDHVRPAIAEVIDVSEVG
jgi:hypothetical protein